MLQEARQEKKYYIEDDSEIFYFDGSKSISNDDLVEEVHAINYVDIRNIVLGNKEIKFLLNAKTDVFFRPLPFSWIRLNVSENVELIVHEGIEDKRRWLAIYTFYKKQFVSCMFIPEEKNLVIPKSTKSNELEHMTMRFVCCFLDLIHCARAPLVVVPESEGRNRNRAKRGKSPVKEYCRININDRRLKRYIYDSHDSSSSGSRKPHFVRGSFMRFWNKNRYAHLYSLSSVEKEKMGYQDDYFNPGVLMKFKYSYVKGCGNPVKKDYVFGDKFEQ